MIHTFQAVGQPMLLDVGSGAVHAIDDMAFDVLEMWNDHTPEEIRDALKEKYTAQELDEVIGELKQLEELGALNAPDNYDDVKQVTEPGVVKSMCLHAAHDCNLRCKYCFAASASCCRTRSARRRLTGWWHTPASASIWSWTSSAANR